MGRGSSGSGEKAKARIGGGRFTVTRLHHGGAAPHRLLVLGSRAVLAPEGQQQAEALGQRLADRVWLRTRHGVDLDMLWELRPVLAAIRDGLSAWRLWRYDAVVILTSVRPATLVAWWGARQTGRLLRHVAARIAESTHVLVVSLAIETEGAGPHRGAARATRVQHLHGGHSDMKGVALLSGPADVRTAADLIARALAAPLAAAAEHASGDSIDAVHRKRLEPDDEAARQRAVERLPLDDGRITQRLQHVVDLAQDAFDSASAEITILDHDRQWTLAAAGERRDDSPRSTSLCDRSIQRRDATVIPDTWSVPGLRGNPLITGSEAIRFYAAHPIESIDGYRIGVLCVWDHTPRRTDHLDIDLLRDLALLAEAEIISADQQQR